MLMALSIQHEGCKLGKKKEMKHIKSEHTAVTGNIKQ